MKRFSAYLLVCLTISFHSYAQFGKLSPADSVYWANIRRLTQLDYQNMLDQLHIDSTRPGPSGNPQAPNAANSDEIKSDTIQLITQSPDFK